MQILNAVCAGLALSCAAACSGGVQPTATATPAVSSAAAAASELPCQGSVTTGALPTWARAGFSPPDQAVPHVLGSRGEIVGVIFGQRLVAPPATNGGNKLLWVARPNETAHSGDSLGTELAISARLNGVGTTATASVAGGPGPSLLDLPAAGCWTVTLTWSGRTDSVALPYAAQ